MSDAAEARRALGALVAGDEHQLDLPRAALLIALEEYAGLDPRAYLDRLDELGQAVRARIAAESAPERQLAELNALLFGEEGFRGNAANYYDPRNSYLNEVLDRRLGIPITLSLIYIEVGRRAGLPLSGVGFRPTSWWPTRPNRACSSIRSTVVACSPSATVSSSCATRSAARGGSTALPGGELPRADPGPADRQP